MVEQAGNRHEVSRSNNGLVISTVQIKRYLLGYSNVRKCFRNVCQRVPRDSNRVAQSQMAMGLPDRVDLRKHKAMDLEHDLCQDNA